MKDKNIGKCTTCKFNKGEYQNCTVGDYYADSGQNVVCYNGGLWEANDTITKPDIFESPYHIIDGIYEWLMRTLPFGIMYKGIYIDTQHKMWIPRWGYTKKQLKKADEYAEDLMDSINWD